MAYAQKVRKSSSSDGDRVSALIDVDGEEREVWFRAPGVPLRAPGDIALALALLPAMTLGEPIEMEAPVSRLLLSSLPGIQDIFGQWIPSLRRVSVQAKPDATPSDLPLRETALFFTGGVDSCYSLLENIDAIDALVYVHGFDIRLDNRELRNEVSARLRDAAEAFGKPLIEPETNCHELLERFFPGKWQLTHGLAMAAMAYALSARFERFLVAATDSYSTLKPCGSHPLLDPLWMTEHVELVHDGCAATRSQKIRRLARSDAALRNLRVCWENRDNRYNCCRCEKCLRTMIGLHLAGALDRCPAFPLPLDPKAIAEMYIGEKTLLFQVENLERLLETKGAEGLAAALAHAIRTNVRQYDSPLFRAVLAAAPEAPDPPEDPRQAAERLDGRALLRLAGRKLARKLLRPFRPRAGRCDRSKRRDLGKRGHH